MAQRRQPIRIARSEPAARPARLGLRAQANALRRGSRAVPKCRTTALRRKGASVKIDPDITVSVLLELWKKGLRGEVHIALANDHPGLTAFFLQHAIANRIIDR